MENEIAILRSLTFSAWRPSEEKKNREKIESIQVEIYRIEGRLEMLMELSSQFRGDDKWVGVDSALEKPKS